MFVIRDLAPGDLSAYADTPQIEEAHGMFQYRSGLTAPIMSRIHKNAYVLFTGRSLFLRTPGVAQFMEGVYDSDPKSTESMLSYLIAGQFVDALFAVRLMASWGTWPTYFMLSQLDHACINYMRTVPNTTNSDWLRPLVTTLTSSWSDGFTRVEVDAWTGEFAKIVGVDIDQMQAADKVSPGPANPSILSRLAGFTYGRSIGTFAGFISAVLANGAYDSEKFWTTAFSIWPALWAERAQ